MELRRLAIFVGAVAVMGAFGLAASQQQAHAQAGVTYGDVEAVAALGAKAAPNAKGPISRVEFSRGYPGAPGMADDKYVVLVTTGSTRACAIMGDKDETLAVYDLIVSKKIRNVRCVTGTDAYGRVRLETPNGVVLSAY